MRALDYDHHSPSLSNSHGFAGKGTVTCLRTTTWGNKHNQEAGSAGLTTQGQSGYDSVVNALTNSAGAFGTWSFLSWFVQYS